MDSLQQLVFDPAGPMGFREDFLINAIVEGGGFVLAALVFPERVRKVGRLSATDLRTTTIVLGAGVSGDIAGQ